jgi:hypothetical protein
VTPLAIGGAGAVAAAAVGTAGWLLRRGRVDRMIRSLDEALAAAAEALPGFHATDAVIGEDGRTALAMAADYRIAVIHIRGRRALGREIGWIAVRQTHDGLEIDPGDRRIGIVLLHGVSALDVRRLGVPALAVAVGPADAPALTAA